MMLSYLKILNERVKTLELPVRPPVNSKFSAPFLQNGESNIQFFSCLHDWSIEVLSDLRHLQFVLSLFLNIPLLHCPLFTSLTRTETVVLDSQWWRGVIWEVRFLSRQENVWWQCIIHFDVFEEIFKTVELKLKKQPFICFQIVRIKKRLQRRQPVDRTIRKKDNKKRETRDDLFSKKTI